jgi:hypothetical protein
VILNLEIVFAHDDLLSRHSPNLNRINRNPVLRNQPFAR